MDIISYVLSMRLCVLQTSLLVSSIINLPLSSGSFLSLWHCNFLLSIIMSYFWHNFSNLGMYRHEQIQLFSERYSFVAWWLFSKLLKNAKTGTHENEIKMLYYLSRAGIKPRISEVYQVNIHRIRSILFFCTKEFSTFSSFFFQPPFSHSLHKSLQACLIWKDGKQVK